MARPRRAPRAASPAAPASAFLDDMRALATAPNPDQHLLLICDKWTLLKEEGARLYRRKEKGYLQRIREMIRETDMMEVGIANTPARTAAGRRAKADAAMCRLGDTGTIAQMARSTLADFMHADLGLQGGD